MTHVNKSEDVTTVGFYGSHFKNVRKRVKSVGALSDLLPQRYLS